MPSHSTGAHATKTDGRWRVMRFETASGKYAEVASNEVGPEAIKLPPGYKFVRSTPMVPAETLDALVEEVRVIALDLADNGMHPEDAAEYLTKAVVRATNHG